MEADLDDGVLKIAIAGKTYLTDAGLAKALKKSTRTVRRWGASGKGPPKRKLGNTSIYDEDIVPDWIESLAVRDQGGRAA
jgi:hypothetical protein